MLLLRLADCGVDWFGEGAWGPLREADLKGIGGEELEGSIVAAVTVAQVAHAMDCKVFEPDDKFYRGNRCEHVNTRKTISSNFVLASGISFGRNASAIDPRFHANHVQEKHFSCRPLSYSAHDNVTNIHTYHIELRSILCNSSKT